MHRIFSILALSVVVGIASSSDAKTPSPKTAFVNSAAHRGLSYVELGELALQRGQHPEVKRLARRLIDDNARSYEDLLWLVAGTDTEAPKTLDLEQRGIKSRLASLSGAAFDRAYLDALRTNQIRDIALYRTYAASGDDPDLKSWAADRLLTLRKQQQWTAAAATEVNRAPAAAP
jgi:putative membrane protein